MWLDVVNNNNNNINEKYKYKFGVVALWGTVWSYKLLW